MSGAESALLSFLSATFPDIVPKIDSIDGLTDGVLILKSLHDIAPSFFPTDKIKHVGENWVKLKKIIIFSKKKKK
jgi:hypothetical protein